MKSLRIATLVGVVSTLTALQSWATPMNLTESWPDLAAQFLSIDYTSGDGTYTASGYTTSYVDTQGGPELLQGAGDYTLTATITGAGVLTAGSISINGDVGAGTELLLSGELQTGSSGPGGAFGFVDAHGGAQLGDYNIFEFLFTIDGGSLANDFGGLGASGGVVVDAQFDNVTDFAGDWTTDFHSDSGNANANNFAVEVVPEPSSAFLIFLGLAMSATSRHRAKALFTKLVKNS